MDEHDAGVESELRVAGGELAHAAALAREQIAARLFMAAPPQVRIADRYLLGDRIGAGGQGSVWRARDEQLDRDVAIKVVHLTDLARGDVANRLLRREAQMLGRLAHPGVVAVFDLGLCPASSFGGPRDDRMALFLVMELVGGVPLDEWVRTGDRTTKEILDAMAQVAAGLAAVHACGLVHCDVKPGNILVDGATAKLADFGLAHATRSIAEALDEDASTDASTMRSLHSGGVTLRSRIPMGGTPRYMAPEQMSGGMIDARADEFALAATLFEALYGRPPHHGVTLQALRIAKLRGAPAQPDKRLGKRAYAALSRSLAPDPAMRWGDVALAMDAITAGRRRDGRRVRLGLGCLAVLGVLGFAMPTTAPCARTDSAPVDESAANVLLASIEGRNDDATRRLTERVASRLRLHADAQADARASACAASQTEVVSCLDRVEVAAEAAASALADLDERGSYRALQIVEAIPDPRGCLAGEIDATEVGPALDPEDGAAADAWAQLQRARALLIARKSRAALDILDEIDTSRASVLTNDVMQTRGDALFKLGRAEEATAVYADLYAHADANGENVDAARAASDAAFATGVEMQRFDEGLAWVRHGESQLQRMTASSTVAADLANTRGSIFFRSGRYPEARAELERALELAGGHQTRRLRSIRENLGVLRFVTGDDEAIDFMTESYELIAVASGEEHPDTVAALANLGNALRMVDRLDEARVRYDHALRLGEAVFGVDSVELARLLTGLAELDEMQGDHAAALARLQRAASLRERFYAEDHPERVQEVVHLANLLLTMGELDELGRLIDANVDRFNASFVDTHPLVVDFNEVRGELALRRGRYDEAVRLLGGVVEITAVLGRDREDVTASLLASARVELAGERVEAARAYVSAASVVYDQMTAPEQAEVGALRTEIDRRAAAPPA